ncbi:hypothetical protein [Streptomyces sp. CBMA29]|uniref:hypothetical protein n=1 Tax=Streptomyces sp. CBMA29 TaxID=1896314 RepID=UPI001661E173|nr:hypothetical protein [Streptomyces sp. CBMA29]MBD0735975.1 hypothetical protein [Streptomyces sp. CBMA29]
MPHSDDLLRRIAQDPALAATLEWHGDFDIERRDAATRLRATAARTAPPRPTAGSRRWAVRHRAWRRTRPRAPRGASRFGR